MIRHPFFKFPSIQPSNHPLFHTSNHPNIHSSTHPVNTSYTLKIHKIWNKCLDLLN